MQRHWYILLATMTLNAQLFSFEHKEIVVVIPSYNNVAWYERNLASLLTQTYDRWSAVYIDDCSSDDTACAARAYLEQHGAQDKVTLQCNQERKGALYNLYHAICACNNNAIIVTLDGDDFFAHERVLECVNNYYNDHDVWMTYGTYQTYPEGRLGGWQSIAPEVIAQNAFRAHPWYSTHLRTFYAGLFKRIKLEDLLYEGQFFQVTWDMAFMFPMLEMAGPHARHIDQVLYIYNQANPINDYKVRLPLVLAMDAFIRSKPKYSRLEHL